MELEFQTTRIDCLVPGERYMRQQSFSGELPPAQGAGKIICCFGLCHTRDKELTDRAVKLSGEIRCWVLTAPEDGGLPQCTEGAIPFRFAWDCPEGAAQGSFLCRLTGLDAAMTGSGIRVTAQVSAAGEVYCPAVLETQSPADPPGDLEILRRSITVTAVKAMGDKTFSLDEDLDLPSGAPACARVLSYQLRPRVTEQRVTGSKAVFKGFCGIHLVYMTTEDRLAVWDFEVPFSQFAELPETFDEGAQAAIRLLLADSSLFLEEPGRALSLQCRMTAQWAVSQEEKAEPVTDLYAPRRQVVPSFRTLQLSAKTETRDLRARMEARFPMTGNPVDCWVLEGLPGSDGIRATVCALWYTPEGKPEASSVLCKGELDGAAEPCTLAPEPPENPQWSLGGGNLTVRTGCNVRLTREETQEVRAVKGAEISEKQPKSPGTPSLRIRPCTDTLWAMAKANGSTPDAIRRANGLSAPPDRGTLLVIPVL